MADSLLKIPNRWYRQTLEPDGDYILSVESGGTPTTTDENNWEGDIPWLTPKEITDLRDTIFVSKTDRYITSQGLRNSGAKLLPENTVMLSKRAPVGCVAINTIPMTTNQGFLNFQCGPKLRPLYLAYWLQVNKKYLDMVANGSTYPELYKNDLFEFQMGIPNLDEQDLIIQAINAVQYIRLLNSPLEKLVTSPEELKEIHLRNSRLNKIQQSLMPLLLSGEIDLLRLKSELNKVEI